jgi:hypothetical protein
MSTNQEMLCYLCTQRYAQYNLSHENIMLFTQRYSTFIIILAMLADNLAEETTAIMLYNSLPRIGSYAMGGYKALSPYWKDLRRGFGTTWLISWLGSEDVYRRVERRKSLQ